MANMQALYDLREFAQDLADNLPEDMYDQNQINYRLAVSTIEPTCGCLRHHLTRVSGDMFTLDVLDGMLGHDAIYLRGGTYQRYIEGTPSHIQIVAEALGYPRGQKYDTKELVNRIDYVISIEEQQIKENNFGY